MLPEPARKDVEVADDAMVQRLQKLYPYHAYWKKRGFTTEIVAEYGLTYRSLDNRAVIPFYDLQDHLVGVMTRALDPKCEVKYLWESPNSAKGEFLFGVLQALRRPYKLEGRRIVFLVEGTLDVVKASSLGYPIVATNTNRVSGSQALGPFGGMGHRNFDTR
ncbi:MAG: hypothetical protein MZW92_31345 [Comamonadaceae bacterium]|nr:hypothetical protein [Comamonadaceae bacterium]